MGLALVACMGALTGCQGLAQAAPTDNTLVIGIESEPDILDPQGAGGWVTYRITSQIYEGLVAEDLGAAEDAADVPDIVPGLAKSWDVTADGTEYTFHLRKGVSFTDGTPFDAQAVEYNI